MTVRPLHDRILVKRIEEKETANFLCRSTLRPLGPNLTFTTFASLPLALLRHRPGADGSESSKTR
jgi:hypothetical protein